MTANQRGTALAAVMLLGGLGVLGWTWYAQRGAARAAGEALQAYVPAGRGSLVSLDLAQLRALGLLGQKKLPLEAEYQEFLAATAFDFEKDLDRVILHLSSDKNVYLAAGRFHWPKLRQYVLANGGKCVDRACSLPSSQSGKYVSYFPLSENSIAVALAEDPFAAASVTAQTAPGKLGNFCPAEAPAAFSLRGVELKKWLPVLGAAWDSVESARACLGPEGGAAKLSVTIELPSAEEAAKANEGFQTLGNKLGAESWQRVGAEIRMVWKIQGDTLAAILAAEGSSAQ